MKTIQIEINCIGIDIDALSTAVRTVEGASISFDSKSNSTGDILSLINVALINIPMLVVAILTLRETRIANHRVKLYDNDGNLLMSNLKIEDLEKAVKSLENQKFN